MAIDGVHLDLSKIPEDGEGVSKSALLGEIGLLIAERDALERVVGYAWCLVPEVGSTDHHHLCHALYDLDPAHYVERAGEDDDVVVWARAGE